MIDDSPNISDISFAENLLSICNYEVRLLDDRAFRALMNLVASCGGKVVPMKRAGR